MLKNVTLCSTLLTIACAAAVPAYAIADGTRKIDVPAGDLAVALRELAKQSGVEFVYSADQLKGVRTTGARGEYTAEQAVSKLLDGTKLKLTVHPTGALLISDISAGSPGSAVGNDAIPGTETGVRHSAEGESTKRSFWSRLRLAAADPVAAPASNTVPSTAERATQIEEIVVTAQRRIENAQDVPTSLVAIGGRELETQGIDTLSELSKRVPGLVLTGEATPGQGRPVIRGLSTGVGSPTVGIYLDDVPFTVTSIRSLVGNFTFDPALTDLERVEVLKGPQSTLYGASAMTGLINYISKVPDLSEFETTVSAETESVEGGGTGHLVRATANIPIAEDAVAARITGIRRKAAGFVDETSNGIDNINSSVVEGGRASIRAKFSESFETTVSAMMQDIDTRGRQVTLITSRTDFDPPSGELAYAALLPEPIHLKYRSIGNVATLDLPFATLSNITSYTQVKTRNVVDSSNIAATLGPFFPGSGLATVSSDLDSQAKRFTNELRVTSKPSALEWMLGAFYTREKTDVLSLIRGRDSNGVLLPPTSPVSDLNTFTSQASFEEWAAWGNLTYRILDQLKASVGVRYSDNRQDFTTLSLGNPFIAPVCCFGLVTNDNSTDYLASLTYEPNDNFTAYARFASAYRPGGANVLVPEAIALGIPTSFEDDKVWTYELGIKGAIFDRRMTYAVAVFSMDWDDIQVTASIPVAGGNPRSATVNAGKARSLGAEAEAVFKPIEAISIGVAAAYNDPEIRRAVPTLNAKAGETIPLSSEFASSLWLDCTAEVKAGVEASAGLSFSYRSEYKNAFGVPPAPTQPGRVFATIPGYAILDARAAVEWSRYRLSFRVENVLDKYSLTEVYLRGIPGTPLAGTPIRPRTFIVGLDANF